MRAYSIAKRLRHSAAVNANLRAALEKIHFNVRIYFYGREGVFWRDRKYYTLGTEIVQVKGLIEEE